MSDAEAAAVHAARIAHFMGMLHYESEANLLVLRSLDDIAAPRKEDPAFGRALGIFAHMQIARRVWLGRLENNPHKPDEWFPRWNTDRLRFEARDLNRLWESYLHHLPVGGLDVELQYSSSDGRAFTSKVSDILTHVFNHSTYHRGQIAMLVTECGGQRAVTDFIAITRQSGPTA